MEHMFIRVLTWGEGRFPPDSFSTCLSEQCANARGILFLDSIVSELASKALSPRPDIAGGSDGHAVVRCHFQLNKIWSNYLQAICKVQGIIPAIHFSTELEFFLEDSIERLY